MSAVGQIRSTSQDEDEVWMAGRSSEEAARKTEPASLVYALASKALGWQHYLQCRLIAPNIIRGRVPSLTVLITLSPAWRHTLELPSAPCSVLAFNLPKMRGWPSSDIAHNQRHKETDGKKEINATGAFGSLTDNSSYWTKLHEVCKQSQTTRCHVVTESGALEMTEYISTLWRFH